MQFLNKITIKELLKMKEPNYLSKSLIWRTWWLKKGSQIKRKFWILCKNNKRKKQDFNLNLKLKKESMVRKKSNFYKNFNTNESNMKSRKNNSKRKITVFLFKILFSVNRQKRQLMSCKRKKNLMSHSWVRIESIVRN